jgi:hypothetical protein
LEHELYTRVDLRVLGQLAHTIKVHVHVRARTPRVEKLADGSEQHAQALDLLLGALHVGEELLDALVHDTLGEYLKLEELADKLNETETLTLRPLGCVVFIEVELDLLIAFLVEIVRADSGIFGRLRSGGGSSGLLGGPSTLEVLLTTIQEVLAEELTTSDRLALVVLDALVPNLGRDMLHHLPAQTSIQFRMKSIVHCRLEKSFDNHDERTTIRLGL